MTRMTDEWIARVWKDNPCVQLGNGEIRTGPVRLGFCNVLERPKPGADGKERAYGVVLLFPDTALLGPEPLKPFHAAMAALYKEKAPAALTNPKLREKYHNPLKDQGTFLDKKTGDAYAGFVEGRVAISANSSQTKPLVVDQRGAPITDKARVYSGAWALAALMPGWIKATENPGPTFYLQSLMIVADDDSLGGVGTSNPQVSFAGVKIDPTVNPGAMFDDGDPLAQYA